MQPTACSALPRFWKTCSACAAKSFFPTNAPEIVERGLAGNEIKVAALYLNDLRIARRTAQIGRIDAPDRFSPCGRSPRSLLSLEDRATVTRLERSM